MRARETRRRALRKQIAARVVMVTLLVAAVVVGAAFLRDFLSRRDKHDATSAKEPAATQETWLAVGSVESDPSRQADWLAIFSWDLEKETGFFMYVPRSTLVEVPGYGGGPTPLAEGLALGGEPTLVSALSNLLGIQFDHHVRISDQGLQALFDKFGGVDVDVERKLSRKDPDGRVRVVFAEGSQHLDGKRAAEYLKFIDEQGDEIARAVRHTTVWQAVFEKFHSKDGPGALEKAVAESKDLYSTDAQPGVFASFLARYAGAPSSDLQFQTLPVQSQAVQSGTQIYAPDAGAIEGVVDRYLAGARPTGGSRSGRRIQILNGNGVAGIGEQVANQLIPKGFRVVLDANARSFDYQKTQIVIYSDSKQALALAEEVRQVLGVGETVISRQKQSVVDVTIVVGKDYLKR